MQMLGAQIRTINAALALQKLKLGTCKTDQTLFWTFELVSLRDIVRKGLH